MGRPSLVLYSLEIIIVEVTRTLGTFLMLSETNSSSFSKLSADIVAITSYSPKTMSARLASLNSTSFFATSLSLPEATLNRTYAKIALILHYPTKSRKTSITFPYRYGMQQKSLSIPLLLTKLGFSKILKADKFFKKWWTCLNKKFVIEIGDVLLITDVQKDFLAGGALPVDSSNEIIPVLNDYIRLFDAAKAHVLASRDWHPTDHVSFSTQGGPWPPHCIKETNGAKFSSDLKLPERTLVISKATEPTHESYSAFDGTILANELKRLGVKRLFIGGLATDYCVVNTVIDARKLGLETVVLMDATLGINVNPGDVDSAIETMVTNGALQATVDDFPEAVDALPIEETQPDELSEKPSQRAEVKKKARMRPKGSAKRIRTEHG